MDNQNKESYSSIYYDIYNDISNCRNLTSEQLTNIEKLTHTEVKKLIITYDTLIKSLKETKIL